MERLSESGVVLVLVRARSKARSSDICHVFDLENGELSLLLLRMMGCFSGESYFREILESVSSPPMRPRKSVNIASGVRFIFHRSGLKLKTLTICTNTRKELTTTIGEKSSQQQLAAIAAHISLVVREKQGGRARALAWRQAG